MNRSSPEIHPLHLSLCVRFVWWKDSKLSLRLFCSWHFIGRKLFNLLSVVHIKADSSMHSPDNCWSDNCRISVLYIDVSFPWHLDIICRFLFCVPNCLSIPDDLVHKNHWQRVVGNLGVIGFLVVGFLVSWLFGCLVIWSLGFVFLGFKVSCFQDFKVSKIYHNIHLHIQDFQDFIRWIFGICRRLSFRSFSKFWISKMWDLQA